MSNPFAAAEPLLAEHAMIESLLSAPEVHADAARARKLGRRYAELGQVVAAYRAWRAATDDVKDATELPRPTRRSPRSCPASVAPPTRRPSGCDVSWSRATPTTGAT